MGVKLLAGGLLSVADVAAEVVVVLAAVTEKIGLNPEASRGLALLTDAKLPAGAVTAAAAE